MRHDVAAVIAGLWLAAFGVLFLLDAREVVSLRPAVLWPVLLIGWGTTIVARGLQGEHAQGGGARR